MRDLCYGIRYVEECGQKVTELSSLILPVDVYCTAQKTRNTHTHKFVTVFFIYFSFVYFLLLLNYLYLVAFRVSLIFEWNNFVCFIFIVLIC